MFDMQALFLGWIGALRRGRMGMRCSCDDIYSIDYPFQCPALDLQDIAVAPASSIVVSGERRILMAITPLLAPDKSLLTGSGASSHSKLLNFNSSPLTQQGIRRP